MYLSDSGRLSRCQQAYDNMQPGDDLPDHHQYTGEIHIDALNIRFDFDGGDLVNICQCDADGNLMYDGSFETWIDPRRNELHDLAQELAYDKWLDDVREGKYDDY